MSQETALQFISKVQTDETLRTRVSEIGQDLDALRRLAAYYGFEFSAQDFQNSIKARLQPTRTTTSVAYNQLDAKG